MNIEDIRDYCLTLPATEEDFPFDEDVLVFKVMGKIFLLMSISHRPLQFNVKCDPEKAVDLRERYEFVIPGYHMNKKHWNTIQDAEQVPDRLLREWIRHSYDLVVASLKKADREKIQQLNSK